MANEFPAMPDLPIQPWWSNLTVEARMEYEANRTSTVTHQGGVVLGLMGELPDFAKVPIEAREYLAERVGRGMLAAFEGGVQSGVDTFTFDADRVVDSMMKLTRSPVD